MAQFEFVAWLAQWLLEQDEFAFDWDEGNSSKSTQKHKIGTEAAEQRSRMAQAYDRLGLPAADRQPAAFLAILETLSSL
jgi:hypothetical protein